MSDPRATHGVPPSSTDFFSAARLERLVGHPLPRSIVEGNLTRGVFLMGMAMAREDGRHVSALSSAELAPYLRSATLLLSMTSEAPNELSTAPASEARNPAPLPSRSVQALLKDVATLARFHRGQIGDASARAGGRASIQRLKYHPPAGTLSHREVSDRPETARRRSE